MKFFATTAKGLELLLAEELRALGASDVAEKLAGVVFSGDLALGYRACLWSRLANRILLPIAEFNAETPDALYQGVEKIDWSTHFDATNTLSVQFVSVQSQITHTLFGAQKVKDAIVDQFRQKEGIRPSIQKQRPDFSIYVFLFRDVATVSLDLSGESLHRRGYRTEQGAAPLKETLAAGILLRANWPSLAKEGKMLLDPMCGSGTLLIEGAMIASDSAPGLLRDYMGFLKWKKHDVPLWNTLVDEARERRDQGLKNLPPMVGFDEDPNAIKISFANIERAGLQGRVHVEKRELSRALPTRAVESGLLIVNPPYGERLGEINDLKHLYGRMGDLFKAHFLGWKAGVFTGNPDLGKTMGLRAKKRYAFMNGAIPCELLLFDIEEAWFIDRSPEAENRRRIQKAARLIDEKDRIAVQMFVNRLKKNIKHISRWAKREGIACYRVYDADLPDYAVTIDIYPEGVHVKSYPVPKGAHFQKVEQRLNSLLAVLSETLGVPAERIFYSEKAPFEGEVRFLPRH